MNGSLRPFLSLPTGSVSIVAIIKLRFGYLVWPFSVSILMLMAIFGVGPSLIQGDVSRTFYGVTSEAGISLANLAGFVGYPSNLWSGFCIFLIALLMICVLRVLAMREAVIDSGATMMRAN